MTERELAQESVFYALFRVVEIAEYSNAEAALAWAQSAVDIKELREGLVDGVVDARAAREARAASAESVDSEG